MSDGKPIMALVLGGAEGRTILHGTHPALKELFDTYAGTACRGVFRSSSTCVTRSLTPGCCTGEAHEARLKLFENASVSFRRGTVAFRPRQSTLRPTRQNWMPRPTRRLWTSPILMAIPKLLRAWCFQMLNKFAPTCFLARGARS